jgi:hypothetical protein
MPTQSPAPAQRHIKVFLASPSDVQAERESLARLIADINDVLTFLAPEPRITLELVRYETHAYPDIGQPQEVINRQIPIDYDIFIGVMWRRCGTPTKTAKSGTIEEFRRAYEQRRRSSLPKIMFYFCDEPIPMPSRDDLKQLEEVVKFRSELASIGLTQSYPRHEQFGEFVRGGLLRAIRDLLNDTATVARAARGTPGAGGVRPQDQKEFLDLAAEYEELRLRMKSGWDRTQRMAAIFSRMTAKAATVKEMLPELQQSPSAGIRLGAIAVLKSFPDVAHLEWLADRLDPDKEKPFVGYQAAVALLEAVQSLPVSSCGALSKALGRASELAARLPDDGDRIRVLEAARAELEGKCPESGGAASTPRRGRKRASAAASKGRRQAG